MSTLQKKIAGLLGKPDQLTSAECQKHIEQIGVRLEIIRARSDAITSSPTGRGKLGPERERIAGIGSPADLLKLNEEEALLGAEDSSLCHQRAVLLERQKKAVVDESPGIARRAIKRLGPAIKAAESAMIAQEKTLTTLQNIQIEIRNSRRIAQHDGQEHAGPAPEGLTCPSVKPASFERLSRCLGWIWEDRPKAGREENVRQALKQARRALTEWQPEQPVEPLMPWQRVERRRQAEARRKQG